MSIDDTSYAGNLPYRAPTTHSPLRLINGVDPVMGTTNAYLACGEGAENRAMVAPANPGSEVAFNWVSCTGGNWPHNTDPIITCIACCEGTTCDKYDATNANRFKIDQAGQRSDDSGWWMADIMQGTVEVLGVNATAREVSATNSRPDLSPQSPVTALEQARD